MGFLVSQHGQLGAIPPPPLLSVSPVESIQSGGVIPPPPQKGYLSDTGVIPYKNKANGCDTPLCDTISKRYCAIGGGISHWAAKFVFFCFFGVSVWGFSLFLERGQTGYFLQFLGCFSFVPQEALSSKSLFSSCLSSSSSPFCLPFQNSIFAVSLLFINPF